MSAISKFFSYIFKLPPAEYDDIAVERNIKTPMSDGVELLADRYYPRNITNLPTILVRSSYGKGNLQGIMYGQLFAERGFQVLIQSCRGTFGSGGKFNPFFNERNDGLDTIAWIKKQPWFNGILFTVGMSYLGYVQWAIAAEATDTIKAMALAVTASQFRGQTYPGDAFSLQDPLTWTFIVNMQEKDPLKVFKLMFSTPKELKKAFFHLPLGELDQLLLGKKVKFWQDWLENSEPDYPWWKPADHSESVKRVNIPVNMVAGWFDIFLPWQIEDYISLRETGNKPYLTIGPWSHTSTGLMGYSLTEALEWFKVHLPQSQGHLRKSPVRVYVMGSNLWKNLDDWPPMGYQSQAWFLHPHGKLSTAPPAECEPDKYIYDPKNPTPNIGGAIMSPEAGSRNNKRLESRPDVLTFTSDILKKDIEIIGPVTAEIFVQSSLEYTDFFVRLCDVHPSGKSFNICDGIKRLRAGRPPKQSDGCIKVNIELWPTAYLFKKGHRIRVMVSSGAFPRFARNTGSGEPLKTAIKLYKAEQKVFHDPQHTSAIFLPVKQDA